MRTVIWNLIPGGKVGQQTLEQKLQEGEAYIEKLKSEGEKVVSVENDGKKMTIILE